MDFEKNKRYIQSVCKAGGVVASVAKVLCILAAVLLVLGVLLLSFLPAGTVRVEEATQTRVFLVKALLSGYTDAETFEALVLAGESEGLTVAQTEDGYSFAAAPTVVELENRTVAIALLPQLVSLAATAVFYHFLARALKKEAVSAPLLFDREAAAQLKLAGTSLWILCAAPWITGSLVQMITGVSTSMDADLMAVLWGFVLHALARLMEYGATAEERSFAAY